jgi:predicted permease
MRLLVSPLLAFALVGPLGLTGMAGKVGVLENAVPSAVMGTIVASRYETEPSLVAGAVLVSTMVSVLTVTLLLTFMFRV